MAKKIKQVKEQPSGTRKKRLTAVKKLAKPNK